MHQEQLQQPYPLGGAPLSQGAALALLPAITVCSGEGLLEGGYISVPGNMELNQVAPMPTVYRVQNNVCHYPHGTEPLLCQHTPRLDVRTLYACSQTYVRMGSVVLNHSQNAQCPCALCSRSSLREHTTRHALSAFISCHWSRAL